VEPGMSAQVNIHQAKTHFSKLIERVGRGEEIVVAKAGKPVAKLVPIKTEVDRTRTFGMLKGKVRMAEDFDAPLLEELWNAPIDPTE
jgi:prevent-host-death family protein